MTDVPAMVVGAGPAGSVVARELASRGTGVLLVDQVTFPRAKVCGCCLNAAGVGALEAVGLGHVLRDLGAVPLRRARLAAGRADAEVALPGGVAVSRDALDAALLREAEAAGAAVLTGVRAKVEEDGGLRVTLTATSDPNPVRGRVARAFSPEGAFASPGWQPGAACGEARENEVRESDTADAAQGFRPGLAKAPSGLKTETLRPEVVVLASGLPTRADPAPGSRLGAGVVLPADAAPAFFVAGTIYMATARGGYVGLVRLEDGRLDLAAAFDAAFVKTAGGLGAAAADVLKTTRWPRVPGLADAAWKGTPALTRAPAAVAGPRTFAVGDAAGYVEPFTGEGMAWAVAGAAVLAPIVQRAALGWAEAHAAEWRRAHARVVGGRQGVCRAAARALRSPAFTRLAVRALAVVPALARPVTAALNRPPRLAPGRPA